ncbi:processed acidic surface protein [Oceanobacillus sp. 1P07AA]|uniref:processed acidic surface protein n=1 Tax=Oceanobacillus sp. 1P07AA TaxID=3132293 RepID=UPI0039A646A7
MRNKFLSALFIIMFSFTIIPTVVFALEADDPEFEAFLEEIDWDKEEYIEYLDSKYYSLDGLPSTEYLGIPVTEKTLEEIYNTYDITHEELNEKLRENGQLLENEDVIESTWFLFIEDVAYALDQGVEDSGEFAEITDWDEEITEENIQGLLEYYDFSSSEELEEYLNSMNDSIENYETIWELELAVDSYIAGQDFTSDGTDDFSEGFDNGMDLSIWDTESYFPTSDPNFNVLMGLMPIAFQAIFF